MTTLAKIAIEKIVDEAVKKAHADFAARVAARIAADPPRTPWTGPETSGADLRKSDAAGSQGLSDVDARREGAALGKRAGEALAHGAAALRARKDVAPARPLAAGGVLDAFARAEHLENVSKATPGFVGGAAVAEAQQRAAALVELTKVQPAASAPHPPRDCEFEKPREAPTPEEWQASGSDAIWRQRLIEHAALPAVLAALRRRVP